LFLAAILDLCSRRFVGWATSPNNDTILALDALRPALKSRRPAPGLLHHSDRGGPYASDDYRAKLKKHRVRRSMSRKGDCWDNAVAESFFATLRTELVDHERYAAREAARNSIGDYIDNSTTSSVATLTSATSTPSNSNCDQKFISTSHGHAVHENGGTSGRSAAIQKVPSQPHAIEPHALRWSGPTELRR
jgi:hypothetical protein